MEDRDLEDKSQVGEKEYSKLSFPRVIVNYYYFLDLDPKDLEYVQK